MSQTCRRSNLRERQHLAHSGHWPKLSCALGSPATTPRSSLNEKADLYAAAICIKVRSDCSLRGCSATKAAADPCCEGRNGPQTLSEFYEVSSNDYFFFFLAVFLAVFFAFFAFLAMLPSIFPKVVQCRPTIDMHAFRVHHNIGIDTACFEEGKRTPSCDWMKRAMCAHPALCGING